MKKGRRELTARELLLAFKRQGGVVTETQDGHLKLYKRVERPGQDPGYLFIAKLRSVSHDKSADTHALRNIRAQLRRNGFDV